MFLSKYTLESTFLYEEAIVKNYWNKASIFYIKLKKFRIKIGEKNAPVEKWDFFDFPLADTIAKYIIVNCFVRIYLTDAKASPFVWLEVPFRMELRNLKIWNAAASNLRTTLLRDVLLILLKDQAILHQEFIKHGMLWTQMAL